MYVHAIRSICTYVYTNILYTYGCFSPQLYIPQLVALRGDGTPAVVIRRGNIPIQGPRAIVQS